MREKIETEMMWVNSETRAAELRREKNRELSGWEENSLSALSFGFDDGHAALCERSAAFWNFLNKLSETQHSNWVNSFIFSLCKLDHDTSKSIIIV